MSPPEATYQDMLDTVPPIKPILVALNPCGRCSDSNPGSISDVVARRCCLDGNDTAPLDISHKIETWMLGRHCGRMVLDLQNTYKGGWSSVRANVYGRGS